MNGRKNVILTDEQVAMIAKWGRRAYDELEVERMRVVVPDSGPDREIRETQKEIATLIAYLRTA